MAGKSTYMRQVALVVILAQMGGFVPADAAHVGLVDRLFTPLRRHRRAGVRGVDLHGGDEGDGAHPAPGHAA